LLWSDPIRDFTMPPSPPVERPPDDAASDPRLAHLLEVRKRVLADLTSAKGVRALLSGRLEREAYVRYLVNARHYAQYSPRVMALAAARCMGTHPELATYLLHHADEEQGHDRWALQDLRDLGVSEAEALAARPVPSCAAMVGYVHYVAAFANPVGLFGWMYVLEAVGDDFGTLAGKALGAAVGAGGSEPPIRFVARHGVADAGHTRELADQIRSHVRGADQADVRHVADVVADLYVRMFREIGGEQPAWA
jgi:pyrroloquinoline quinone (PQQ) biosynthesis protein C